MRRLANRATPFTAATVLSPDTTVSPGAACGGANGIPVVSATVTFPENPVAVFPNASRAVTSTAGVIGAPAVWSEGCTVNTSVAAGPGVIVNGVLVTLVRPATVAVRV